MAHLKFGDAASIAAAAAADSPIARMIASFGTTHGRECGNCTHFRGDSFGTQCGIYSRTARCKTWHVDWQACGKYETAK